MSENQQIAPQFAVQRVYMKDMSFESPSTPEMFQKQWQPESQMELSTRNRNLGEDHFEVELALTITVKNTEETAFVVEVHQAGIFFIKDFSENDLSATLGAFCPNILFPYAREAIDSLVTRGGFPPLMLSPINFDAMYQQARQQQTQQQAAKAEPTLN